MVGYHIPTIVVFCILSASLVTATDVLNSTWLESSYTNGSVAPGTRDGDSPGQYIVIGETSRPSIDNTQSEGCDTIFIGTAESEGSFMNGYSGLPQVVGFDQMRDVQVSDDSDAVLPYYMMSDRDLTTVKRVVIINTGKLRTSWGEATQARNSLICAANNATYNLNMYDVLVVSPIWMNEDDESAGAVEENDIYFRSEAWEYGGRSRGPGDLDISSYEALNALVESFFDADKYPNVTSVVVGGHSMGGQLAQRFAMLKPWSEKDEKIRFWVANPGSWTWPVKDRPLTDDECEDTYDQWKYGLNDTDLSDFPKFARDIMADSKAGVQQRYYNRTMRYALGLEDDGSGDTNCGAQWQGTTHLERGKYFNAMLNNLTTGFPSSHAFDYIEGISHQGYYMMAANQSQYRLFVEDL